jgi:hypothetical protein
MLIHKLRYVNDAAWHVNDADSQAVACEWCWITILGMWMMLFHKLQNMNDAESQA